MHDLMRDYELVLIAVPQLEDAELTALTERVTGWVSGRGGAITKINVWGRRQLAYAIRRQSDGFYVQFDYQLDPAVNREFERNLQLDEQIIRYLIVRLDED